MGASAIDTSKPGVECNEPIQQRTSQRRERGSSCSAGIEIMSAELRQGVGNEVGLGKCSSAETCGETVVGLTDHGKEWERRNVVG